MTQLTEPCFLEPFSGFEVSLGDGRVQFGLQDGEYLLHEIRNDSGGVSEGIYGSGSGSGKTMLSIAYTYAVSPRVYVFYRLNCTGSRESCLLFMFVLTKHRENRLRSLSSNTSHEEICNLMWTCM